MVCGVATSVPPVMSKTPSTAPVSGSRIGAAEQLHGVTGRTRCSAPTICTGRPRASAVPGAFVPALASLQSAPGMKCIPSARVRSPRSPSTHSSCPAASLTATSRPASAALSTSRRRMMGMAAANGWVARISASWAASSRIWGREYSGSRPLPTLRRHESTTTRRNARSIWPVWTKSSCA